MLSGLFRRWKDHIVSQLRHFSVQRRHTCVFLTSTTSRLKGISIFRSLLFNGLTRPLAFLSLCYFPQVLARPSTLRIPGLHVRLSGKQDIYSQYVQLPTLRFCVVSHAFLSSLHSSFPFLFTSLGIPMSTRHSILTTKVRSLHSLQSFPSLTPPSSRVRLHSPYFNWRVRSPPFSLAPSPHSHSYQVYGHWCFSVCTT